MIHRRLSLVNLSLIEPYIKVLGESISPRALITNIGIYMPTRLVTIIVGKSILHIIVILGRLMK